MGLDYEKLSKIYSNPFYCLDHIALIFTEDHQPLVSKQDWIKSNANLIKYIGAESWLTKLLENLEGDFVTE